MSEADPGADATLPKSTGSPKSVGERLRDAREAQGLSLAEIAARTRVPIRHLEAIESSSYDALPSVTYAVGFAKAYARAVGIDEVEIAREVRAQGGPTRRTEYQAYEIKEPSRVPTRGLALVALAIAVLLLVAIGLWYGTSLFRQEDAAPATAPSASVTSQPVPAAKPATPAGGQVTLVATDEVWMRVYDATGKKLFQNTLKAGERYEVPADADHPMINVGRPDKLQVMLNGSILPPLGSGRVAIKDVGISSAALTARGTAPVEAATPPASTHTRASSRHTTRHGRSDDATSVPPAFAPTPAPADSAPSAGPGKTP